MSCVVDLRGAATDLLHPVVRAGLATLRGALSAMGRSLPRHVQKEVEGFLGCGDPVNGFAWLRCAGCDHHRRVTFACKGRGFCPRCGGRRMAATSDWWIDRVLPNVATWQWVVTMPWKRRWLLARRPERASGVHTVALRTTERGYAAAGGAPKTGRTGSVTATQRFGSALDLNLHVHCIFLDGIYTRGADDRLSFRRVVPHTEDIERLVVRIAGAADDAQAVIQRASLLGQAALGERAGKRARRVQVLGGQELAVPPRCASFAGYGLHAGVGLRATDRASLERLCRSILRPPLAKERLQRREDGNVVMGLTRAWRHGTSAFVFSPAELVERLVALVPPPPAETSDAAQARRATRLTRHPRMRLAGERPSWSDRLERVFRADGLACPGCGGPLALRCVGVNPPATRRILDGLRRATGPPGADDVRDDRGA